MATVNEPRIYNPSLSYEERRRLRQEWKQNQNQNRPDLLELRRSASPVLSVPFRTHSPTIPASHSPTMGFVSEYAYICSKSSPRGSPSPQPTRVKNSSSPSDGFVTPNGASASDLSFAAPNLLPGGGTSSHSIAGSSKSDNTFAGLGIGPSMNGASNVFVNTNGDVASEHSPENPMASAFSSWRDIGTTQFRTQSTSSSPKSPRETATSSVSDANPTGQGRSPRSSVDEHSQEQKDVKNTVMLPQNTSSSIPELNPNITVTRQPVSTHYESRTPRLNRGAQKTKTSVFRQDLADSLSQDINVFTFHGENDVDEITFNSGSSGILTSSGQDQKTVHEEKGLPSSGEQLKRKRSEMVIVPSTKQEAPTTEKGDAVMQRRKDQKKTESEHKSGKKEGRRISGLFSSKNRIKKESTPPKQSRSGKKDAEKLPANQQSKNEANSSGPSNLSMPNLSNDVVSPIPSSDSSDAFSPTPPKPKLPLFRRKSSTKKGSRTAEESVGKTGWTFKQEPDHSVNRSLYPARSEMSLATIGEMEQREPSDHSFAGMGRALSLEHLAVPKHSNSHQSLMTDEIVNPPITVFHSGLNLFDSDCCDEEGSSENRNDVFQSPLSVGTISLEIDDDQFLTPGSSPQPASSTTSIGLETRSEPVLQVLQSRKPPEGVLVGVSGAPEVSDDKKDEDQEKCHEKVCDVILPCSVSEPAISVSETPQSGQLDLTFGNQVPDGDQTAVDTLGTLRSTTPFSRQSKSRQPVVRKQSSSISPRSSFTKNSRRTKSFTPHNALKPPSTLEDRAQSVSDLHSSESGTASVSPATSPLGTPVLVRGKFGSGRSTSSGRGSPVTGKQTPDSGKGSPVFGRVGSGRGSGRRTAASPQISPLARKKSPSITTTASASVAARKKSPASSLTTLSPLTARKKSPTVSAITSSPVAARKKSPATSAVASSPVLARKKPQSAVNPASSPVAARKKLPSSAASSSPKVTPKYIHDANPSPPAGKKFSSSTSVSLSPKMTPKQMHSDLHCSKSVKTNIPQTTPMTSSHSSFRTSVSKSPTKSSLATKSSPQATRKPTTYVAKMPKRKTSGVKITSTSTSQPSKMAATVTSSASPAHKTITSKSEPANQDTPQPPQKVSPTTPLGEEQTSATDAKPDSESFRNSTRPTNITIPMQSEVAKPAELSLSPQSASSVSSVQTPGGRKRRIGVSASMSPLMVDSAFFPPVESSSDSSSSSTKASASTDVDKEVNKVFPKRPAPPPPSTYGKNSNSSAMDIDVSEILGSVSPTPLSNKGENTSVMPTGNGDKNKVQEGKAVARHSIGSGGSRKTPVTNTSSVSGPTSPRRLSTPANAPTKAPTYVYQGVKPAKASSAGDSAKSHEPTTFRYKGGEGLRDSRQKISTSAKPKVADGKRTAGSARTSAPVRGTKTSSSSTTSSKSSTEVKEHKLGKPISVLHRTSSPVPSTMSLLGPIDDILSSFQWDTKTDDNEPFSSSMNSTGATSNRYSLSQPVEPDDRHTLMASTPEVPVWSTSSQSVISNEPQTRESDELTYIYRSALLRNSAQSGIHEQTASLSRVGSGNILSRTSSNRKVSTLPRNLKKTGGSTSTPKLSGLDPKSSMRKRPGSGLPRISIENSTSEKSRIRTDSLQRPRSASLALVGSSGNRKASSGTLLGKPRSSLVRASGRKSQVKKSSDSVPPSGPSVVFKDKHGGLDGSSDESDSSDSVPNSPIPKRVVGRPPTGLPPLDPSSPSRKSTKGLSKSQTTSALTNSIKADSRISRSQGSNSLHRKSFSHRSSIERPPSGSTKRKSVSKSKPTAEVQIRASIRASRTSSSGTIRKMSAVGGSPSHVPLGKRPTPPTTTPLSSQGSPVHRSLRRGSSVERDEGFSAFDHISLLASNTIESSPSDHRRAVRPKLRQKPSSTHLQILKDRKDISSEMEGGRHSRESSPRKLDPNSYSTYMGKKVLDKTALAGLAAKLNFDTVKLRKTGIIEDMMSEDQGQVADLTGKSSASPAGINNYGVPLTKHPVMLIQIKGRKLVQTRLVEPVATSINSGDVYVLVTDKELFQWIGKGANVIEKARSSDIVSRIQQRKELGCHVTGFVKLDDGGEANSKKESTFWDLLNGRTKVKDASSVPTDEVYEKAVTLATTVYSYQGEEDNGQFVIIHEDKQQILKIALLDTKKILLFDFYSEVYIWIGKHSPFAQRKPAMFKARKMFDMGCHPPVFPQPSSPAHKTSSALKASGRFRRSVTGRRSSRFGTLNSSTRRKSKDIRHSKGELQKRPEWALFGKVTEGAETILFREKFADWPEPGRIIKMKGHESSGEMIKPLPTPELQPVDVDAMLKPRPKFVGLRLEGENIHRGKGNYKVSRSTFACNRVRTNELTKWHVKEYDNVLVPPKDHGIFYSEEGYVIRWAYIITVVRELEGLTPGEGMFARDRKHRKQLDLERKSRGNKQEGGDAAGEKKKKNEGAEEVNTSSEEEDNSDDECQRILESGGRDRAVFFFWQGEYASVNEKGAAAVMTVELDKERCPQVRVVQGKEHPTFLQLFRGGMIILCGKSDSNSLHRSEKGYKLYTVRGQTRSEAVLLEIDTDNKPLSYFLRSRSCYVLHHMVTKTVFLWVGCQANSSVRSVASFAVKKLRRRLSSAGSVNFVQVQEGFESQELLSLLGGRDQYHSLLNGVAFPKFSPRLFELSSSTGWFVSTEVLSTMYDNAEGDVDPFPFLQEDIYHAEQPAFFLLDAYYDVYLWLGWWPQQKNKLLREKNALTGSAHTRWIRDKKLALQTAFKYAEACKRPQTPDVFVVNAGSEHHHFTNMFPYWNENQDVQELNCKETSTVPTRIDAKSELAKYSRSQFTLEELRMRPPPEGVDSRRLETYLSDADFQKLFRMTRDQFQQLLAWKQTDLKKRVGLF